MVHCRFKQAIALNDRTSLSELGLNLVFDVDEGPGRALIESEHLTVGSCPSRSLYSRGCGVGIDPAPTGVQLNDVAGAAQNPKFIVGVSIIENVSRGETQGGAYVIVGIDLEARGSGLLGDQNDLNIADRLVCEVDEVGCLPDRRYWYRVQTLVGRAPTRRRRRARCPNPPG